MNKIVENESAFQRNLSEEKTELRFSKEELAGIAENTMATFGRDGDKYIITMKYPDVFPVLETCSVAATRRDVFIAFGKRGGQRNLDLMEETLKLRKQAVSILGYVIYINCNNVSNHFILHVHSSLVTRIILPTLWSTPWPKLLRISVPSCSICMRS